MSELAADQGMAVPSWSLPGVRTCGLEDVLVLRHAVLRAHQSLTEARFVEDDDPTVTHFRADDEQGLAASVATVVRQAPPWEPGNLRAWRLRGMATARHERGKGFGKAVLQAIEEHVARQGGELLWCNARAGAVGFYSSAGFRTRGAPWEEPVIGPHVAMTLLVTAPSRVSVTGEA